MVHLKAAIFILSLVLLEAAKGRPTRFANVGGSDVKTEILQSNVEEKGSDVPLIRLKRVSDQRLAELETLYALSRINLMTTTGRPLYMKINPVAIGRRRRNASDSNVPATRTIERHTSESTINDILIS